MPAHEPTLRIEPEMARWRLAEPRADASAFRRELGLPTDRPLIMVGHEAMFWHPGVLAKYLAARTAADRLGAHAAWLLVDHDLAGAESTRVRYPARGHDGRIVAAEWTIAETDPSTPACRASPGAPDAPIDPPAAAHVADGLARIRSALIEARNEGSLAAQIDAAQRAMLAREIGLAPDADLPATRIPRTRFFAAIIERMRRDPDACADAYNHAVDAHPEARLARLGVIDAGPEMPAWVMTADPNAPRTPATVHDLAEHERLAPRALLLTACMRLAACDLFIHGVGGSRYDTATEHWIARWLGLPLAPRALVTATLRLPLDAEIPDVAVVRRAAEQAHKAKHDPAILGDHAAAADRIRLVAEIARAKKAGVDASRNFAQLQELLTSHRARHAGEIAELERKAKELAARAADAGILDDRTWAWPLFPRELIQSLEKWIGSISRPASGQD